jgi:Domain of unknown function (DUF5668)/B-box zinc finger
MKCANHPEEEATGYCRNCGKALCPACTRNVQGMVYCEPCLAALIAQPPEAHGPKPGLAACLGIIPGMGAVYNGQYMKAVVQVGIFALVVAILSGSNSDAIHTFFGIGLAAFIVYMMVDAHRVAAARLAGHVPADMQLSSARGKAIGPFILIGLGIVFLLNNFHLLDFDRLIDQWWPLILIIAGAALAWRGMAAHN